MPSSISNQRTPRNVYVFGATSFLNDTATEMAYWILPGVYRVAGRGAGEAWHYRGGRRERGVVRQAFFGIPFRPRCAAQADRGGPILRRQCCGSRCWRWFHRGGRFLGFGLPDRFAKGVRGTARDVMVADSFEKASIGSAYGLIQAMDSAGAIAGPLLALALIGRFGMRGVFAWAAVPGALCVLVAWVGIREVRSPGSQFPVPSSQLPASSQFSVAGSQSSKPGIAGAPGHLRVRLPFGFYYVLAVVTLFSLGNSSDMFLVLRAGDVGIPASHSPLLGLVFNVTFTLASWRPGKFSDRFSRSTIAAAGYGVFAVVYFVFALLAFAAGDLAGHGFLWILLCAN